MSDANPTDKTAQPLAAFPEIPLNEIPESTKDFLIASAAVGKSVTDVIVETLDRAASESGFTPAEDATPERAA